MTGDLSYNTAYGCARCRVSLEFKAFSRGDERSRAAPDDICTWD